MKITIKDIARIAGVSTATVSKILNKKDQNISETTRNRVLEIIKKYGYVPNRVASSLVTKRTNTLGLIIPDIVNPFFPELARGAEDKANERGYNLILCNSDNNVQKEEIYVDMLKEKMVDGIIFTASSRRTDKFKKLTSFQVPVITVDREIEGLKTHGIITVNNVKGAYDAVKYLLNRGYKKILHLTGPMTSKPTRDRYEGYCRALIDEGFEIEDCLVCEGDYSSDWGYEGILRALKRDIKFDSVFCGNDLIAIGAIKALKVKGFDIPREVGVIGFDDIYMAKMIDPDLTTIKQPNYEMGYKAAELLIDMIEKKEIKINKYVLDTRLVIRKSTK
ncbi:transcriptional regulator, LacI family [Caminicella sporogenes DSM 14501]|uniref:Transcriptional regulator, LacI family n=1 Tax=Caminicella sporogenes DSM 14501 TaxID=1121266 RepID=A0A1M6PGE9_9FIRM|nr:LacI family DNA-binding transcriptional regulator [Caminicella sporogenes]RKD21409.1 LacI family transcriptional regulator [Caminicella sporogenes]SHK07013.1 transcriptional regulator, LacI family [Caminicella sporogenes DSM 14501]